MRGKPHSHISITFYSCNQCLTCVGTISAQDIFFFSFPFCLLKSTFSSQISFFSKTPFSMIFSETPFLTEYNSSGNYTRSSMLDMLLLWILSLIVMSRILTQSRRSIYIYFYIYIYDIGFWDSFNQIFQLQPYMLRLYFEVRDPVELRESLSWEALIL